ncbi:MAG: hypothetical protein FJ395_03390 [Verrucomicrobia bacterium]|nr:hypothetical protein [Verrucomicrobiota bacterium]
MKWICAILVTLAVSVEARLWETEYEMVGRYGQPKDTQAQSPTALDLKKKLDAEKAKRKGGPPSKTGAMSGPRLGATVPPPPAPAKPTGPLHRVFSSANVNVEAWFCQSPDPVYGGQSGMGRVIAEKISLVSPTETLGKTVLADILRGNAPQLEWENMDAVIEACLKDARKREQWLVYAGAVTSRVTTESGVREVPVAQYNFSDTYKLKTTDGSRGAIITPIGVHLWMNAGVAASQERTIQY